MKSDKILIAIISEYGRPVMPADVVREYKRRGWPEPEGKMYNSIFGSMSYLSKRKRVLEKTDKGYRLIAHNLQGGGEGAKAREVARA